MPRLSTELRAERRRHVLASAWRGFSRDGFHATSMDDIIAATGMSTSAVYRYFSGKDELIEAAADEALTLLRDFFTRMLDTEPTPTPAETITALVDEVASARPDSTTTCRRSPCTPGPKRCAEPDVAEQTGAFYRDVHGHLTELALRWRTAGYLTADANPEDVATVLVTLMPGLIVSQHLVDPVPADQLISGLAALGAAVAAS
jgi:AcrR family transcriptional regulator